MADGSGPVMTAGRTAEPPDGTEATTFGVGRGEAGSSIDRVLRTAQSKATPLEEDIDLEDLDAACAEFGEREVGVLELEIVDRQAVIHGDTQFYRLRGSLQVLSIFLGL